MSMFDLPEKCLTLDALRDRHLKDTIDYRARIADPNIAPASRANPRRLRSSGAIRGLVLHSTPIPYTNNPVRFAKIGVHFVILPTGKTLLLYDEVEHLSASQALSSSTVAVEFQGSFPTTVRRRGHDQWLKNAHRHETLQYPQIEAGRRLVNYLRAAFHISHIYAHIQSGGGTRRADCPGRHVWYNVGQWAVKQGLSDGGPGFTRGNGLPIPDEWRQPYNDVSP